MVSDPLADLARLEGVASGVAAARAAVDAVLADRGLRVVSGEQVARSGLAGAHASAGLTEDPERWGPGAVRLASELATLAGLIRVAPGQALARAHVLAASGQVSEAGLGRIRTGAGVATRMQGLHELLTGATAAPALVLAAVAHAELATVAPFGSADGLVARAVEHMILVATGVDPHGVVVCEAGHAADPGAYAAALAGYASGRPGAVRDWLLHCARALAYGADVSPLARPRTVR